MARTPIVLLEADDFVPADRDPCLDGVDSILSHYGFDPVDRSPRIRAIVISVHPNHRGD